MGRTVTDALICVLVPRNGSSTNSIADGVHDLTGPENRSDN